MRRMAMAAASIGVLSVLAGPAAGASDATKVPRYQAPGTDSAAASTLRACLATSGRLLVVVLVDTSGSLKETDPFALRVPAIKSALSGFARLSEQTGKGGTPTRVDVMLAGFADSFQGGSGWSRLDRERAGSLMREAEAFGVKKGGFDGAHTDYRAALEGARDALANRAVEISSDGGPAPCKLVVWFTDGKFDVGSGSATASRDLCRPGEVPDQIRDSNGVIYGVALTGPGFRPTDRDYLSSLIDGTSGAPCGTSASPERGAYLPVDDASALALVFCCLVTNEGPSQSGAHFDLYAQPGVKRIIVNIVGTGAGTGTLTSPSADSAPVAASAAASSQLSGAELAQQWFSPTVGVVELTRGGAWGGSWSLDFEDEVNVRIAYEVDAHLEASLSPHAVEAGKPARVEARLVDGDGTVLFASTGMARTVRLSGSIDYPANNVTPLAFGAPDAEGTFTADVDLPVRAGIRHLSGVVHADLSLNGAAPAPVDAAFDGEVQLPRSFPRVSPTRLLLPGVDGNESASGEVTITGGRGGGCFEVPEGASWRGPQGVRINATTSTETGRCVPIEDGRSRRVAFEFDPSEPARGRAAGTLQLAVENAQGERAPVTIAVEFEMSNACAWCRALAIGGGVLASLVISLAVLYVMNRKTARFAPLGLMFVERFAVSVMPDGSVERDGRAFRLDNKDIKTRLHASETSSASARKAFTAHGVNFEAKAKLRHLLTGPIGIATVGQKRLGAGWGGGTLGHDEDLMWHAVPLGLSGTWVFVVDRTPAHQIASGGGRSSAPKPSMATAVLGDSGSESAPVRPTPDAVGTLVVFISDKAVQSTIDPLTEHIVRSLPGLVRQVRSRASSASEPARSRPGRGPGPDDPTPARASRAGLGDLLRDDGSSSSASNKRSGS